MPTPTLDAYRSANPNDKSTDAELVPKLVQQLSAEGTLSRFPDLLAAQEKMYANPNADRKPSYLEEGLRGVVSGTDSAVGKLYSTAAQMGDLTGNEGLKNWGMQGFGQKMQQAAASAPSVSSMSQIHSPDDALRYGLGFAGGFLPQAAGIMGVGAAGTLATGGDPMGGLAATMAAMYTQSQNYGELVNQGAQDPAAISVGVGALGAVLQAYVPHQVFSKLFGNVAGSEASSAVNSVLERTATSLPGLGQYMMKDMAKQGGTMAVANIATEIATMAGEQYANRNNPNYTPLTSQEIASRLIESGASGGLLGAGFGAVEGISDRGTDRVTLPKLLAARNSKEANEAAFHGMVMDNEGGGQPQGINPTPAPVAPPEEAAATAPLDAPSSAAFTPPNEPETPVPVATPEPQEAPPIAQSGAVPEHVEIPPEQIQQTLESSPDPDLARRAALGQVTQDEVMKAITPQAAPEQNTLPSEPAGKPIEPEPTTPPPQPPPPRPVAPAEYIGEQEGYDGKPPSKLYNLTKPIDNLPVGTTVSDETLQKKGFALPATPEPEPAKPVSTDATPGNAATPLPPAEKPIERPPEPARTAAPVEEKLPIFSTKPIADTFPPLRVAATYFQPGAGEAEIGETASKNARANELSTNTSSKLLAVHDRSTDSVKLLPLFQSSGHRWRTALSAENPGDIIRSISNKMGLSVEVVKRLLNEENVHGDLARRMFGDQSQRVEADPFVSDLVDMKDKDGNKRFTPLAMLDTMEPIQRRVFEFKQYDDWVRKMQEEQAKLIPKSAVGGTAPSDATMEKLKQISTDHARLVQTLGSMIEQARDKIPSLKDKGPAEALPRLLNVPHESEMSEKLGAAKIPEDLIRKFGPVKGGAGKWLGLFTDEELPAAVAIFKDPKLLNQLSELPGDTPAKKLLAFIQGTAQKVGYKDWKDYIVKATRLLGSRDTGEAFDEERFGKADAELSEEQAISHEEAVGGMGTGTNKTIKSFDESKKVDKPISKVRLFSPEQGDAKLGGLSLDEFSMLQHYLNEGVLDAEGNEEEGLERHLGTNVKEAREDSDKSGPETDETFHDIEPDLRAFIDAVFDQTRGKDSSMLTEDQVYKIWNMLDRAARNTMPATDDYRETNTEISNRYRATVSSLQGMGVDVNLVEQSLDAQADLLSKEMEQVQFGDGRRILIQTMSDLHNPSMENLRTTLHGAAHILFYQESASVRALLLDAVDRMTNLKLDVFSKTRDLRLKGESSLSGSLLAEEVLAEHMSYFGLKQEVARGLAGRFIGALKQIYLRGAILWSQVRGYALDPKIAQEYMESRMQAFVDKTLNSTKDLDVMTGNVRENATHAIKMFKPIDGEWHQSTYDPLSGATVLEDVIPNGRMETLFNLDNHLQLHDYVLRNTETDRPTINYFKEHYGISDKPVYVEDALNKIQELYSDPKDPNTRYLVPAIDGIKENMPKILAGATMRFASTPEDFARLRLKDDEYLRYAQKSEGISGGQKLADRYSPAIWRNEKSEILLNPVQATRYDALGAAETIVHEITHAGTIELISLHSQWKTLGRDTDALTELQGHNGWTKPDLERVLRPTDQLDAVYQHLLDKKFYPGAYGMLNLHEFASEAMRNRIFQIKLSMHDLPDKLTFKGKMRSAFAVVKDCFTRIWSSGTGKDAFTASLGAIERIMQVADAHLFSPSDIDARAPMTEEESNHLVKRDYEYQYAAHNSWIDLVNNQLAPLAKKVGVSTSDYLYRLFGTKDPHDARAALDESVAARNPPIQVNKDLRLSDAKGDSNRLQPGSVRDNIVRSVLSKAMGSLTRLDEIHDDTTRTIPKLEEALKAKQARFGVWDKKLNDMMEIRDSITKNLRAQLKGLNKNLSDASYWSTQHDGLAGVVADLFGNRKGGYGLPMDIVHMIGDSVELESHSDRMAGLLAAFEHLQMNVMGRTPHDIEADLQAKYQSTRDPRLAPFIDGSPQAKVDLGLAVYIAKTDPEDTMLLGIRSEHDMILKQLLVNELKSASQKATEAATPIPDLIKLSDQKRARVLQVRKIANKYKAQLEDASHDVNMAKLVTQEAAGAKAAMQTGITDMQRDTNIQAGSFHPSHGASILLTPDPMKAPVQGKLSMLPKDTNQLIQHIWDNQKWLDQNQGTGGPIYSAVKSQFNALKSVAGGYFQSDVQKSRYAQIFESDATRLRYTGNPTAKMAADMWDRYVSADRMGEKLTFIGRDVTKALGEAQRAFGFDKNYDGFIRSVFNPMCHFLEHFDTKKGDEGTAEAKEAVRKYFVAKPETADWMRKNPAAFDKLWDFYNKNLEANHGVRDFAASDQGKIPVLVKDSSLPIKDPFTGRVGPSYRAALDTGYGTTQRDTFPLFELKRTLDSVKSADGRSVWSILPKAKEGPITPDMEKSIFTPEVLDKFVQPYMDDVSSLHFPAPRLEDGYSYNKATPFNVQEAWREAHGDVRKFSDNLYEKEKPLKPAVGGKDEYHQDILRFFQGQYKKIDDLTEGEEEFQKRGFGPNFISSNMMDTRKAEDFPPEFTKYRIYDHISLQQMVNNIAAHGTFGRDLGLFDGENDRNHGVIWMLHQARQELASDHNNLLSAKSTILRRDPRLASEQVEKLLQKQFGDKEYKRLNNLPFAMREVDAAEKNLFSVLTAPNGSTREFSAGAGTLQTMVEFMLNNFRSVLTSSNRLIAPYQVYGAGRLGHLQVARSIAGSFRNTMGSFVQAMLGDARMATAYDRAVHDSGVGLDRANFMTPATIIADTGKNNAYESQRYLGTVRKGRDIIFNTGWKPKDEEERIAPAFRPQAPYAMLSEAMDLGVMSSEAQNYNDLFKSALKHYQDNPMDANNPAFRFTKQTINPNMPMPVSDDNMTRFHEQLQTMGTTLELTARDLFQKTNKGVDIGGDVIVPKHLMPLIVSQGLSDIALSSDVNKGPAWMYASKFGRFGMFLMKWATLQMNQVVGMAKTRDGELNWRNGKALAITMAAGILPASMCISMLLDEYDEHVLGKKSNAIGFNWNSPSQTAAALLERTSRIGTFGLMGDVANGLRVYGSDGDTRGLSFDQRVVFMNTLMSTMSLVNTAVHQDGHLTYDTFYRPLLNTLGGNSILQYGQIMNQVAVNMGGGPIFQSEYEQVRRINALNYLRGAGREAGVEVREGSGDGYVPTPLHPYMSAMVLAAYSNDISGFEDAYRGAVAEAKSEGDEEPEERVKRSFAAYHPLKYVFQSAPTPTQTSRIMMALSDKGRSDVSAAISSYNKFASLLGIKSPEINQKVASRSKTKASPSAF